MKNKWTITDPSCNQMGRKIGEKKYVFREDVKFPDNRVITVENEIDLNEYTDAEINDHLSPYGYTMDSLINENSLADAEWLFAECIFEQTIFN